MVIACSRINQPKPLGERLRAVVRRALRGACQHYPFVSGQHYISSFPILTWSCGGVGEISAGRKGADFICVDLTDASGRSSYFFGCNDGKIRNLIKQILRPSDTFVDIGANYGSYSLLAANLVGPTGSVHSFEPQPHIAAKLRRSAMENQFEHLKVHEVALSDEDRAGILSTFSRDSGTATLLGVGATGAGTQVPIRVVHTGKYLTALGLGHVRLLKIDVEDHEFEVMSGALEFLKATPPDYLIFEYDKPASSFHNAPLVVLFRTLGYSRIYEVPHRMLSAQLRRLKVDQAPSPTSVNFLVIHDGVREHLFED